MYICAAITCVLINILRNKVREDNILVSLVCDRKLNCRTRSVTQFYQPNNWLSIQDCPRLSLFVAGLYIIVLSLLIHHHRWPSWSTTTALMRLCCSCRPSSSTTASWSAKAPGRWWSRCASGKTSPGKASRCSSTESGWVPETSPAALWLLCSSKFYFFFTALMCTYVKLSACYRQTLEEWS